jgi:hypothetical protein
VAGVRYALPKPGTAQYSPFFTHILVGVGQSSQISLAKTKATKPVLAPIWRSHTRSLLNLELATLPWTWKIILRAKT